TGSHDVSDQEPEYGSAGSNLGAVALRCFANGVRDRAHPADGKSPGAAHAVDLAQLAMQKAVSVCRSVEVVHVAGDRAESVGQLGLVAFEIALQQRIGALRHDLGEAEPLLSRQAHDVDAYPRPLELATPAAASGWGRALHAAAKELAQRRQHVSQPP